MMFIQMLGNQPIIVKRDIGAPVERSRPRNKGLGLSKALHAYQNDNQQVHGGDITFVDCENLFKQLFGPPQVLALKSGERIVKISRNIGHVSHHIAYMHQTLSRESLYSPILRLPFGKRPDCLESYRECVVLCQNQRAVAGRQALVRVLAPVLPRRRAHSDDHSGIATFCPSESFELPRHAISRRCPLPAAPAGSNLSTLPSSPRFGDEVDRMLLTMAPSSRAPDNTKQNRCDFQRI
jgi:hypothetical protein